MSFVKGQVMIPENAGFISEVIGLAWDDKASFETIRLMTGLSEPEVIALMRQNLKPSSFRLWRRRVSGRIAKHSVKHQTFSGDSHVRIDW